jgi:hypothetical protein
MPLDQTLAAIKEHLQADQIFVHGYQCQSAVSELSRANINSEASATTSCHVDPSLSLQQELKEKAEQTGPTLREIIAGLQAPFKFHDEGHPDFPYDVRRRRLSADLAYHSDSGYSSLLEPSGPIALAGPLERAILNKAQAVPQAQPRSHDEKTFVGQPKRGATYLGVKPNIIRRRPPRLYCSQCSEHPEGFRGEHELSRHRAAKHQEFVRMWICVDPCGLKKPDIATNTVTNLNFDLDFSIAFDLDVEMRVPLNKCKACRSGKRYGAYYNAAAHLRRAHFEGKEGPWESERLSMQDLKPWIKAIYVSKDGVVRHDLDAGDTTAESCMQPSVIGHPIAPRRASIREDLGAPDSSKDTVYSLSDESMEYFMDLGDDIIPDNADVSAMESYCRSFPQRSHPR